MNIKPIDDTNTNFELVEIKDNTPHCKIHGAMNKVSSYEGGGYWRCISSISNKQDNTCRAGCIQQN